VSLSNSVLETLNQKQREAVTYGEGPLLIVAGAGTGKTQVITRRIAWLIATKRAKPEEILALTFTEKAAAEMEERVDILVPYGYTGVWIGTFHAFGDNVLRENALLLGLVPDLQVLTRPEQIIFFRDHLFEFPLSYYRPLGNPTRYIEAIVTLFSRAKDEDVAPEEYLAYAEKLKEEAKEKPCDPELKEIATQQMEIARSYKKYQDLLAEHGKIDFGDQITLPLKLFRTHPAVLRQYQDRFRYILVDEFQDTNYTQFQLVKLLASRDRNITVVADDDQSIYKFRGAAISNILNFMDTYHQAKQTVLTENFRSTQVILDAAYRLITHNNPDRLEFKNNVDKYLKAQVMKGPSIKHLHYDTLSSEAEAVANLIKEKVEREGFNYRDFAILVRANDDADPFLRSLNMTDIPWSFSGNEGLYSREEVRLLISFLRSVANFDDSVSLYYLAASEVYRLSARDLTLCMNYASRRNRSLYHVFSRVSEILELSEEISPESKATISRIMKDLEKYSQLAIKRGTGEVLYSFIMDTGYLERLTSLSSSTNEEKVKNIAGFFDIVRSISNVITYDRIPQFTGYLDLLIEAGDNPAVAEADTEADAVNVLTVHKAKGLEFPVVIMVSLVSQKFPCHYRRESISLPNPLIKDILPSGDFHLQEERRLFYVGMTRAKKELYFTSAKDYGGKRPRRVSQFVLEALDLFKMEVKPQKSSALEVIERSAPKVSTEHELYEAIPETEILTVSYFQIDDYLTCPLKYKYVHVLRVPILPHHAVIYGKALHDAVQEYYRRKLTGVKITEEELLVVFENSWMSEGFLTRQHEEQRLEVGRKTLRGFYQMAEAEKHLPIYVEKEFSFLLENNRITGRWDRVDIQDGEVCIIDFKSSEVRKKEKADKRARESLQLAIYALAYQKIYGKIPDLVELHFLESGLVGTASLTEDDLNQTVEKIGTAAAGIRARVYQAKPAYQACRYCAYEKVCPYTALKR
jgi:DNA helicase-2/ATP-dependent DNA helicase PcrA